MIFAGIQGLQGLYSMLDPESNLDEYAWQNYADIEQFKRLDSEAPKRSPRVAEITPSGSDSLSARPELTEAQWQQRWEKYRANQLRAKELQGRRMLVYMLIAAIVCLPLFMLHWRYARRSTMSTSSDNSVDK
jgi:hypothetical protein